MNSMVVSLGTLAGCLDIANIGWVFGEWAGSGDSSNWLAAWEWPT